MSKWKDLETKRIMCIKKTKLGKSAGYCCVKICANSKRTHFISTEQHLVQSFHVRVYVCAPGRASPGSRLPLVVVVVMLDEGSPFGPGQSSPCDAVWSPFKFL